MSILVVGSVAFDDVTSPSGNVKNILGGAATYFSLAASYFTEVRVVAVVGEDFGAEQEQVFRQHGIDTRGLERAKGKTFRWGGSYTDDIFEAKTNFTDLNVFETFSPAFRRSTRIPISFSWRIFSPPCKPTYGAG